MDYSLKKALLLLIFSLSVIISKGQSRDWVPVNAGLEGGQVDFLWQSPHGTFFAGGGLSGLFRSSGYLEAWEPTTLTEAYVGAMSADSTGRIIAGTDKGVFISSDEGLTWEHTDVTSSIYSLAVLPSGDVFVGSTEGVHRQKRGEHDWSLVGQWNHRTQCIYVDPEQDDSAPQYVL